MQPTAGERKVVTALFADFSVFSTSGKDIDPEDLPTIVNQALERLSPTIFHYEGTVAQVLGNSMLAFFGAPLAHEDDAVRAVRAALEMITKARELAVSVRAADSAAALDAAASGLKSLWMNIEMQASDARGLQETLKRVLLLLVENIGELLDDDTWLRGQLDVVQKVIAGPIKIRALQDAEKRLKEVIYKQSMVKHGLREATANLKATMTTFVSRMGDAVAANDEYQGKIAAHIERTTNMDILFLLTEVSTDGRITDYRAPRHAHDLVRKVP